MTEVRDRILENVPIDWPENDSIEFLYPNGDDNGWNWGRTGSTNAAFLYKEARKYFRKSF